MVLIVYVCDLCAVITASGVVGPTGIPNSPCTYGDPNWVFPIGICGEGSERIYLLVRLPTHPRRTLGDVVLSYIIGGGGYFCVYTIIVLLSLDFRATQ